jgi:hypothetical protein
LGTSTEWTIDINLSASAKELLVTDGAAARQELDFVQVGEDLSNANAALYYLPSGSPYTHQILKMRMGITSMHRLLKISR